MLAVVVLLFGLFSNTYTVHFEGTAALREGQPLLYREVQIGSVDEVGVGKDLKLFAEVKIKHKFRDLFREGCAVSLDDGRLELTGVDRNRPALPDGATVSGLAGAMDYLRYGIDKVRDKIHDLQVQRDYDRLLAEMDRAWEKGKREFRKEWPEFKRRLKEMRNKVGPELKKEYEQVEETWKGKAEKAEKE